TALRSVHLPRARRGRRGESGPAPRPPPSHHTLQAGGELFHPAADPALDGSLRSTEALGHLDVAETAVVGQRDRLTLPFGKFFEGGTDMLGKAATPYLVLEVEVLGIGRSGLP